MATVGDTLKRHNKAGAGPASVRIVGVSDGRPILQDAEAFAPPFPVTAERLQREYGATFEAAETEADRLRAADAKATESASDALFRRVDRPVQRRVTISDGHRQQAHRLGLDHRTPEERFTAAEDEDDHEGD